jgi:hypothetical protein
LLSFVGDARSAVVPGCRVVIDANGCAFRFACTNLAFVAELPISGGFGRGYRGITIFIPLSDLPAVNP